MGLPCEKDYDCEGTLESCGQAYLNGDDIGPSICIEAALCGLVKEKVDDDTIDVANLTCGLEGAYTIKVGLTATLASLLFS